MNSIITQKDVINSITIKNGQEVVRSDKLAKVFGKQHKVILRLIKNEIMHFALDEGFIKEDILPSIVFKNDSIDLNRTPSEFLEKVLEQNCSLNKALTKYFIDASYINSRGKKTARYYLTRKGFDFIALGLTGREARRYKRWYIDAFHDMLTEIKKQHIQLETNLNDDLWLAFREEGKVYRKRLTNAIKDTIVKYREDVENKQNDGKYYLHYTRLIYKKLGIDLPKSVNPRDVLDKRMLVRLEDMEDYVANLIYEKAESGMYYKDVYKEIKKIIESK